MSDLYEVEYFADAFDRLDDADGDLWAYRRERHLAAVLHVQVQQFFLGLEAALAPRISGGLSRGRLLQLGLSVAHELSLEPDEGDPDLFEQFVYMHALANEIPFDASYAAGFAVDGSVSILIGPDLPPLRDVGIRGTQDHDRSDLETALLIAKSCTRFAARIGVLLWSGLGEVPSVQGDIQQVPAQAELLVAADISDQNVDEKQGEEEWVQELRDAAVRHYNVWSAGSEDEWATYATNLLAKAGLLSSKDELARAQSSARTMTLWALHLEFAAHTDAGSPGDWTGSAGMWVDEGLSHDQIVLLNSELGIGWPIGEEEYDVSYSDVCADIIRHYHREVADAVLSELGDSWTFAYLWATRYDDVSYPLEDEHLDKILNTDAEAKLQGYFWVESGMDL